MSEGGNENYLRDEPLGTNYEPDEDILSLQDAADRIGALYRTAQRECYLPDNPEINHRNAGRVRAFAQTLTLLERAGLEPDDGEAYLNDDGEIVALSEEVSEP